MNKAKETGTMKKFTEKNNRTFLQGIIQVVVVVFPQALFRVTNVPGQSNKGVAVLRFNFTTSLTLMCYPSIAS